jgi:eukaryotic-like serine/threonine-protein kinase
VALETGEQIGPYEILAPLARGGMGEVYRARDNRLRREVALKMLPDAAAHDADSLARFDRETRAVAALSHPNILAIHDTGSFRAIPWAVTELLQGESLAERLRGGPLAPEKAVDVAAQVADGLAAAHARGIIHRDIKPENIFLTHEGRAKILDFGIARIEQPARTPGISGAGRQSTSSQFLVGTAGYMSPEQVRGKRIDARTDVFSLGATFYEMLTGRRAFARETPVETLGAVLRDDPTKHPETEKIPEILRPFVFRCLEKDPTDRYQSAKDLLMDLRAYQAERLSKAAERVTFRSEPPWKHRRTRVMLRGAGGVVLFVLGLWAGSCWERERAASPGRPSASSPAR